MFGAILGGARPGPAYMPSFQGQALSGFTQCIPDSKVNRLAFPRSMIRIFAYPIQYFSSKLPSEVLEKAGGREYPHRKGLESEREKVARWRGCAAMRCLEGAARYFGDFSLNQRIDPSLVRTSFESFNWSRSRGISEMWIVDAQVYETAITTSIRMPLGRSPEHRIKSRRASMRTPVLR